MTRTFSFLLTALFVFSGAPALNAQTTFTATLNSGQVVTGGTTNPAETGVATFTLNNDMTALDHTLQLFNLDLAPATERTDTNDVDKIHIHNAPAGVMGPHTLNIFGLPSEDDGDLVVNFAADSLSGTWTDADQAGDQNSPDSTKPLSLFVNELQAGNLYIAVHTLGAGGGVAIRGQIVSVVPEPATGTIVFGSAMVLSCVRRRRRV